MLGTYALSAGYYDAYYLKAQRVRTIINREFAEAFQRFDVIVTPTAPTPAFRLGAKLEDPFAMYLNDVYTIPASVAGLPAISVPAGLADGLPTGIQVIGDFWAEGRILSVAHAFERATGLANRLPFL
jgi:aspartyl-tRNA(Asn)/glutamyl-tRNA(Gln) amidotransferase subunit A